MVPVYLHGGISITGGEFLEVLLMVTVEVKIDLSKTELKSQDILLILSIPCLDEEIKGSIERGIFGESCA